MTYVQPRLILNGPCHLLNAGSRNPARKMACFKGLG